MSGAAVGGHHDQEGVPGVEGAGRRHGEGDAAAGDAARGAGGQVTLRLPHPGGGRAGGPGRGRHGAHSLGEENIPGEFFKDLDVLIAVTKNIS